MISLINRKEQNSVMTKLHKIVLLSTLLYNTIASADFTEPRLYQPYTHAPYQKEIQISKTLHGHCTLQSKTDKRTDAWHCTAKGKSYDPCFKHKYVNKHELVCPKSPWSKKAVRILTTDYLDSQKNQHLDMSRTTPWAMELTDGTHCIAISPDQQSSYQYKCQHQQYLSGKLFRCKGTWQMYKKTKDDIKMAEIKRAWF